MEALYTVCPLYAATSSFKAWLCIPYKTEIEACKVIDRIHFLGFTKGLECQGTGEKSGFRIKTLPLDPSSTEESGTDTQDSGKDMDCPTLSLPL